MHKKYITCVECTKNIFTCHACAVGLENRVKILCKKLSTYINYVKIVFSYISLINEDTCPRQKADADLSLGIKLLKAKKH